LAQYPLVENLAAADGSEFNFTRNSHQAYLDDNGQWQLNTSFNQPSISKLGVLLEPRRTNYLRIFSDASDATFSSMIKTTNLSLSLLEATDLIARSGLTALLQGRVFEVKNSSNTPGKLSLTRQAAPSKNAAFSVFAHTTTPGVSLSLSGGKGLVVVPATADANKLERVVSENISVTGSEAFEIDLPPNTSLQFVLPQLEQSDEFGVVGVTSPIITKGVAAVRDASRLWATTNNWPDSGFSIQLDITPTTTHQQTGASYYYDLYKNNTNRLRLFGAAITNRVINGESLLSFGKYSPQLDATSRLLSYFSNTIGTAVDGGLPNSIAATQAGYDFSDAILYLGSKQDGSQPFTGWIRQLKIYAAAADQQQLVAMTGITRPHKLLGVTGIPLYDQADSKRIYLLNAWGPTGFSSIDVSNNSGDSFKQFYALCAPTRNSALQRDVDGNFYFANNSGLYKINQASGRCARVINWNSYFVPEPARNWSWSSWHWAVSNEGWLYTASYSLTPGSQVIYRSKDKGETWQVIDSLRTSLPNNDHVHSLLVHPVNNKLYVSVGDDPAQRSNLVSTDAVSVWDEKTFERLDGGKYAPGATGLTWTADAVYWSSDTVGNKNYIVSNGLNAQGERLEITMPENFHITPVYFLLSQGDNRLVSVSYNEKAVNSASGAVMVWQRAGLDNPWQLVRLFGQYDFNANLYGYYALGHNGLGKIPTDASYIYVTTLTTNTKLPGQTLRMPVDVLVK
jgi:hypothetical protein